MDHGPSGPSQHFSYQPGGYPPPQPGYSPYNAPPPGWTPPTPSLADWGPRIVAFLIDRFIAGAIIGAAYAIFIIIVLIGASSGTDAGAQAGSIIGLLALLVSIPVGFALLLFNEVYLAGKNNGQTIGKKVMKIRIVKEDGSNFGYMDAFLRNIIGYFVSGLVCYLGFFWVFFDNRRQGWHDKLFHTVVVSAQ
ncbi:MAG TPA: RDD family protein [Blastocatellia bacterium]